jgi:lipopolysaccharide export system protein LptA
MTHTGNKTSISRKIRSVLFPVFYFLFLYTPLSSFSQSIPKSGGKKIMIEHAGSLQFDKNLGQGAQRLIGDVRFRQDNTLMFCDSAFLYKDNSLDAFGHIHIQQGDSIHLYGDLLKYNGNTKKALITKNVVVNKGDMQLTTDELNYDVSSSVGSYVTPARIVNKENTLTSNTGYFFAKSNDLTFRKNVILTNPQFVINCDTMRYNTTSKTTYFIGPTTIKSKDNLIYTEDGWYDTFKDQSRFSKNSYIVTKEQKMFGDSLYYDRKKGIGKAVKNVQIIDTLHNLDIKGEYAIHYEFKNLSVVTGNALLTQIYEKDTLYLHADTLKAIGSRNKKSTAMSKGQNKEIQPSQNEKKIHPGHKIKEMKISGKDTTYVYESEKAEKQELFAYHKVKFFKRDLQGKCDSLYYSVSDSSMQLFGKPVLWSDENQLTADSIKVITGNKSIRSIELKGAAFIVSEEDSIRYNQIRGKLMKGYFQKNKLQLINVEGNGQTLYFAKEKNVIKAVNRADCSDLRVYMKDNKVDRITFITKPDATLFPLDQVEVKELKLKDFTWRKKDRPLSQKAIFIW